MTTDQKIDEVLKIVREHERRFDRLESRDDQLLRLIQEQTEKSEARDKELLGLILEERGLNNSRFTQLSTGLLDVRKEVGDLKAGLGSLDAKIDKVYEALSQDISTFAEDLYRVKDRVKKVYPIRVEPNEK